MPPPLSAAVTLQLQQAFAALQRGDIAAARRGAEAAATAAPSNAAPWHLLGLIEKRAGGLQASIDSFARALDLDPDHHEAANSLGGALFKSGRLTDAQSVLTRALTLKPDYVEAHYNLGLTLQAMGDIDQGAQELERAIALKPSFAAAHDALCIVRRLQSRPEDAVQAGREAVRLAPQAATARINLALALLDCGGHDEALTHTTEAVRLAAQNSAIWLTHGVALQRLEHFDAAISAYRAALARDPGNLTAHQNLNALLWQLGRHSEFLNSYPAALNARPDDAALRLAFTHERLRTGDAKGALTEIARLPASARRSAAALSAEAKAHETSGDLGAARALYHEAMAADPALPGLACRLAERALKADAIAEALSAAQAALERNPHDQLALALKTTALQRQGDPAHAYLADYARFVRPLTLRTPQGFDSLETFNAALASALHALHHMRVHPLDQTLRNGTQTHGALFARGDAVITALRHATEAAIREYIAGLPDDAAHPFLQRKESTFRFRGSWSALLSRNGFHTNHVHPQGWISSAYYVAAPGAADDTAQKQGWLKFGETGLGLGPHERIARIEPPRTGTLVLFPSYFWHGTTPFTSEETRLTVAFDVVPGLGRPA